MQITKLNTITFVFSINILCYFCEMNEITIPVVKRDNRIGSTFNYLFSVMDQSENCGQSVIWNFNKTSFFHPFFIAPLAIYKDHLSQFCNVQYRNIPSQLSSYLSVIRFYDFLNINSSTCLDNILKTYENRTYIPICRFELEHDNIDNHNIDNMQSVIQSVIMKQKNIDTRLRTPLSYLFGELICNMQQHSNAKYGYMFSQYINSDKCLYICLADNGITIYGSYINKGKYLDEIDGNEATALKMATEGYSTKNLPELENRGYGISSNIKMVVEGLGGEIFILSGGAFHRDDGKNDIYIDLPADLSWNGTIILVKIPVNVKSEFNFNNYIY